MYNPEGFNAHKLQDHVELHGSIAGYPGGKPITREEFFSTKADIFAPCALENQVGEAEARALEVKLIAEGANGPCNPAGERVALDKGIDVLPDVLANSGRRHGQLLRVGPEQALGDVDRGRGRRPARDAR